MNRKDFLARNQHTTHKFYVTIPQPLTACDQPIQ